MSRNLVCAASLVVGMATLALVPAFAQREDTSQAGRGDRPKLHRKGRNAIPQHYIVVLDIDATGAAGRLLHGHGESL